jgi:hypothetical protein
MPELMRIDDPRGRHVVHPPGTVLRGLAIKPHALIARETAASSPPNDTAVDRAAAHGDGFR